MSKVITKRKTKQKEVDPRYGVAEWDPSELDVRQTRHGTYGAQPPPTGGTWKEQFKEEAYKLRQKQREEESPEFLSPHSTTDTMDTDEAQEISRKIKEKMDKEKEESQYLNVPTESKYENIIDVGPTFPTVRELQQKTQETYEEIPELEDSGIVSFPNLDREKEEKRRGIKGKRVPIETESLLTSFDAPAKPSPITFTEPADFEEVLEEGDEYLSRVEQEMGAGGGVKIFTKEGKGYERIAPWQLMYFPLYDIMKYQMVLPFPWEPRVTRYNPEMWIEETPFSRNPVVHIKVTEWYDKYHTESYALDVKEGYLFAIQRDDWIKIPEKAKICVNEPLDPNHETPIQKEPQSGRVHTLDSRDKIPIAESTRKDNRDKESEPRQQVPVSRIKTPKKRLSFEESEDEEVAREIKKEKDEVEKVQWELEMERKRLTIEKEKLERKKFGIAEDRLRALRKQRKVLEGSIEKMSEELKQDVNLVTADRQQRRINMRNEYLNQLDLEEAAVEGYLPTLFKPQDVLPDVMTTDSQISSTVDPIEFMDDKALMKLNVKYMRADQCKARTHKMYNLLIQSAKDPEQREELEQMLLANIRSLDKKLGKFKNELDSYDQKEQYILAKSEQAQAEQEKALKEQKDLKKVLEGLQDEQRVTQEELENLRREKEQADDKQAALKEKINKERQMKIQKEQKLEEERQKLRALEKQKREQQELKEEKEKDKKKREERDRALAKKIKEQEKKEREREDKELARQLQEKQRLEKESQDRLLAEQLEQEKRQEEEIMQRKKEEEQLRQMEQQALEEAQQREELLRLEKEHQKLLEKERKARERRKVAKSGNKPTKEEQEKDKEELMNTIDAVVVNGKKPKIPKDLGWDYLKDKEAKRVFERKKQLRKERDEEKEKRSKNCPECRFPKHPGDCPCKICGKPGHKMEECPMIKPPPRETPQEDFCSNCMKIHPPGRCICKICKDEGHLAVECPWLEMARSIIDPAQKEEEEPSVQICLHCRSTSHKMEDCAVYKAAQAKMQKEWCYGCKQYGHTIVECMNEKEEERNKELEKEIEQRKKQLKEIDEKMERLKKQTKKEVGKEPEDRDTRDYPQNTGRKPSLPPKREHERSESPRPPPREDPPRGPPAGGGGGGGPPGGDDPSDPDDSDEPGSDEEEEDEDESDNSEVTEESGFLYDELGRKVDIRELLQHMKKRKGTPKGDEEIPIKVVRGPRGHRGSKGRPGRKGPPRKTRENYKSR